MSKNQTIMMLVLAFASGSFMSLLIADRQWQHDAVVHHAAFYESNSWGITSFHWNDVSFAQTPFSK